MVRMRCQLRVAPVQLLEQNDARDVMIQDEFGQGNRFVFAPQVFVEAVRATNHECEACVAIITGLRNRFGDGILVQRPPSLVQQNDELTAAT